MQYDNRRKTLISNSHKLEPGVSEQLKAINFANERIFSSETIKAATRISDSLMEITKSFSQSPLMQAISKIDSQTQLVNTNFYDSTRLANQHILNNSFSVSLNTILQSSQYPVNTLYSGISSLAEQMQRMHSPLVQYLDQMNAQSASIRATLESFQSPAIEWFKQNQDFFSGISSRAFEYISNERIIEIRMQSNYWIVVDKGLISTIVENGKFNEAEMVETVIHHYKKNNWKNTELIVERWRGHISPERMIILDDMLFTVKEAGSRAHSLSVLALITQLDGLTRELLQLLPIEDKKRIENKIRDSLPAELKQKRTDIRQELTVQTIGEVIDFWSAEILQEVIFSGLFRNSKNISLDESFSLFRNKIMHGDKDFLKYGTDESFVRLMLYLDFVISLIAQLKNGSFAQLETN